MYTEGSLMDLIERRADVACNALVELYHRQTADEQEGGFTEHSNQRGFNAVDAYILTSFALQVIENKKRREDGVLEYRDLLSPRQLALLRRKLKKYSRQLAEIANQKLAQKGTTIPVVDDARETTPVPVSGRHSSFDWPNALVRDGNILRWKTAEEMVQEAGCLVDPAAR